MRTIPLSEATTKMVTASDLVTEHGQIIVKRGEVLTTALITKLRFYEIKEVDIEEVAPKEEPTAIETEPVAAPIENDASTYTERTRKSPEFILFQELYNVNIELLEKAYKNIKEENYSQLDLDDLLLNLNSLFQDRTTLSLLNTIHALGEMDNIYASNINVAIISRGIGRWLKFPKESLDTATLAGLFHDIGKLNIPDGILNKQGKLTDEEFEVMKNHTIYGQRMLKKVPGINKSIVNAAGQHHEKYDGSGYPLGLEGSEIDAYAAIVAIADVYEAMTAVRPHRRPLTAFQVIESFEKDGLQKYNPKYILTFLQRLANAYQNRVVKLNDDRKARIIYINQNKLSRPIIEFEDKTTLDLARNYDLQIQEIL